MLYIRIPVRKGIFIPTLCPGGCCLVVIFDIGFFVTYILDRCLAFSLDAREGSRLQHVQGKQGNTHS